MTGSIKKFLAAGVITGIGLTTVALARDAEEVRALSEAKISLVQAITAAEQYQGGQAYEAGLEDDSFKPEYEIGVVKDGKVYEVRVDGVSGEVIGAREDLSD
jgi:uncharacterized membrane protein YkoI